MSRQDVISGLKFIGFALSIVVVAVLISAGPNYLAISREKERKACDRLCGTRRSVQCGEYNDPIWPEPLRIAVCLDSESSVVLVKEVVKP